MSRPDAVAALRMSAASSPPLSTPPSTPLSTAVSSESSPASLNPMSTPMSAPIATPAPAPMFTPAPMPIATPMSTPARPAVCARPSSAAHSEPAVFDSRSLLAGATEVWIDHDGTLYRLRRTALGKLILTK